MSHQIVLELSRDAERGVPGNPTWQRDVSHSYTTGHAGPNKHGHVKILHNSLASGPHQTRTHPGRSSGHCSPRLSLPPPGQPRGGPMLMPMPMAERTCLSPRLRGTARRAEPTPVFYHHEASGAAAPPWPKILRALVGRTLN